MYNNNNNYNNGGGGGGGNDHLYNASNNIWPQNNITQQQEYLENYNNNNNNNFDQQLQQYNNYYNYEDQEQPEFDKTEEEIDEEMQRELAEDAPWKKIQQNTFTRWANEHLKLVNRRIEDLQYDLSDGLSLIALIEVLSHKKLPRHNKKPQFRSQKLENVSVALNFLENVERIRLVNIDSTHVVDGKLKLILGLIWTLILHYSITMPLWDNEDQDGQIRGNQPTPKQKLMSWINSKLPPDMQIQNFTTDWNDGRTIGALVDSCAPGLYPDWQTDDPRNSLKNAKDAMDLAEQWLGVPQLIRPEEMIEPKVDELAMMTYLSQYPNAKLKPGAPLRPRTNAARVRCYGKGIEPNGNHVEAPAKFQVETVNAGKGDVEVVIINPRGQKEPLIDINLNFLSQIEFNNDKNLTYTVTYTPTMEGNYKVIVKYGGQEVPKSPYTVFVEGKVGDPTKCFANGPGIEPNGVIVDKPTYFEIDATDAGNGQVEVAIIDTNDPSKPIPYQIQPIGKGKFRVDYVAKHPGYHSINVLFAGKPIVSSPFNVNVAPGCDAKKCRAYGRGIQPKGIRVGDVADFRVVTKDAGEGVLKVSVKGPDGYELPVRCNKVNATNYECGYNPTRTGPHQVIVTYGGNHIFKSPFNVDVGPYKESLIRAFGPGLEGGVVGYPADFVVDTNGETGELGFQIEGPSKAQIECVDNLDGSANVRYWPGEVGEYAVHILCNGEDIPQSPFMAWIEPRGNFDPLKVKAYGPGIDKDVPLIIGKPTEFTVDAREAGDAPLKVTCIDGEFQKIDVSVKNNGNGTYTCRYTPQYPNKHTIFVVYGGVAIPNCPYRVWAIEPSNPNKVRVYGPGIEKGVKTNQPTYFTVDCTGAGNGDVNISILNPKNVEINYDVTQKDDELLDAQYTAKIPGPHIISITFNNEEIPQSPIKVNVEPDVDVSKIKVTGIDNSTFIQSPTEFTVDAKAVTNTGSGKVQCELIGPSGKRQLCPVQNNGDGTYTVQYVPNEVGPYQLEVTYENILVPGSPFKTQGIPGCDPNRVKVYGPGLEGGITNEPCMFTVETKGCGQGSLSLAIEGPSEAKMICKENQNGICIMEYLPVKAGPYDISIKYADKNVPGSPFRVYIEDQVDENKVALQLPEKPFRVSQASEVVVDARNAGKAEPKLDIYDSHGRIKPVPLQAKSDGLFVGTITPASEGPHRLDCKWNGASIPKSPFNINVLPSFEARKVKVDGEGVRNGVRASLPTFFRVDTKEAGTAALEVTIRDPEGNLIPPTIENNHDGTFNVSYTPEDVGRYAINVLYGGQHVKDSPFNVKVDPTGRADKCQVYGSGLEPVIQVGGDYTITVDTREAGEGNVTCHIKSANGTDLDIDVEDNGDGTFNIYYTPHNPGSYTIKIKFGGQEVPNGDVVVTAGDELYLNQNISKSNHYPFKIQQQQQQQQQQTVIQQQHTTYQQSGHYTYFDTSANGSLLEPINLRLPLEELNLLGKNTVSVTARVKMPSGKLSNPNVEQNPDGTVSIKYQPSEIGLHELDVFYNGQPIQGSPFKFHVDAINSITDSFMSLSTSANGYVTAYGPGLSHGVCGRPCEFRIVTKDAGTGGLAVAVEGPSKAEIQCRDNKNGTCDVIYYPTAPGDYTITIKFAEKNIVGSPFIAKVTGDSQKRNQVLLGNQSDISLKVIEGDVNDLHATIRSPSGQEEPCLLKKLSNGSLGISFTPREVGEHLVSVLRDGRHIKNSPFRIEVRQSEIGDPNRVKIYGAGLHEGTANQINEFYVNTKDAGYGGLSLSIEGPSKAEIECHDNDDGSCRVTYKPTEPGVYLITVKFADKNVPGSPFKVNVGGIGSGRLTERITRDRKAVESSHIGSQCELSLKIPGTCTFDMNAYVTSPSGRVEDCEITDLDDCNYCIRFIPKEMGIHTVSVKHKDMHIPGSPFEFTVGPIAFGGSHKVRASGPGLVKGEVNIPADFNIYTREAGAGALAIAVEGPAKAEIDFHDRKDGTCGVSYVCPEPGEYQISIKFNDEHIPDSPFTAQISPPISDAIKNLTVHSLRTKGLEINKPFTFSINANGAKGKVDAKVITPSGAEEYCLVQDMGEDHYMIRFIPHENGIHWIHVRFNGIDIPESPFRIIVGQINADPGRVFASGPGLRNGETGEPCEFTIDTLNAGAGALAITVDGPAKVQLDCKEVAEGYKVSFVPSAPGDYLITIKFVGTNIAGSPFKCRVSGNALNTRSNSTSIPIVSSSTREHSNIIFETVEKSAKTTQLQTIQHGMHSDASKVKVRGPGIQKAFRNQKAQFTVDTRDAGSNMLMVGVYGPKTPCEEVVIKHVGNNQYQVTYCVRDKGEYMLIVKYGDQHISGSPFHIDVI